MLNEEQKVEPTSENGNSTKPPVSRSATIYAVTGTFHGSLVEAHSEGEARRIFHRYYNDIGVQFTTDVRKKQQKLLEHYSLTQEEVEVYNKMFKRVFKRDMNEE